MSDFIPNTFQTPNAVVDKLMELLTDSELRVFLYTIRHVLGWQKKIKSRKATISISNYVNGFSYTDEKGNTHSYSGCGLKEAAVRDALQALESFRILKSLDTNVHGREWELAFMTDDNVDFGKLIERQYEKNSKGKNQMAKARELNPKLTPSVQQNPSCLTEPTPFCSTEPDPSCLTGDNETQLETQLETHTTIALVAQVDKEEFEAFLSNVEKVLKIEGTRRLNYFHLLHGSSLKKQWKATNDYFKTSPMDSLEILSFGKWYLLQCPNANVPTSPEVLEDWVKRYRKATVLSAVTQQNTSAKQAAMEDYSDELRSLKD